ncbi:hypothetical protein [Nonomuraea sp. SYSU D8015]|uniref:hypothetical protein n=1 Tax=Nonomuraea sp. SYSU D8015 TaxID=2593644 RepID=UPI0016612A3D|nr:hypothetical protein [Nonomuraea sp. SYSU D8015]
MAVAALFMAPLLGPSTVAAASQVGAGEAQSEIAHRNGVGHATSSACSYQSYDSGGPGEIVKRKGEGTPKYNDGYTDLLGRRLTLVNAAVIHERSAARLEKAKKGDRVWVRISHDQGKTWQNCGSTEASKNGRLDSKWFQHKVQGRWIRACTSVVAGNKRAGWCADIGDKTSRPDGRTHYWWTDWED